MDELQKKFIAEALAKKYEEVYGKTRDGRRPMTKGHLVDDNGNPIIYRGGTRNDRY